MPSPFPILAGYPAPTGFLGTGLFQVINVVAVAASAGLWWVARSHRVSATRLHTLGLAYEVAICFVIAAITFWQYYAVNLMLPNLTWVPVVIILFPLIMPGPPRRMLAAAIGAGATAPVALLLLEVTGKVAAAPDAYFQVTIHSAFAIGFAYSGAKLVYGLGREVTVAREFGSYHLAERLGEGGMGEVWRAQHRMLARSAAIKLIRPSVLSGAGPGVFEEARRRFEREAQAIALLRSPHTVELYDFGVSTDGAFYYVMELLEGLDADTLVRRFGPVPAERAIHLLRQVAWYAKTFGGKAGTRNNAPVVDVPGAQLRFGAAETPQAPTRGRVLDHIGFDVKDLQAFIRKIEAEGIKLDEPYRKNEATGTAITYITDPWGTRVELVQRPPSS